MFERVFLSLLGIILLCISSISIYGWKTHNYELISLYSHSYPIQFNTALLFGILGLGTIAIGNRFKKTAFILSCLIGAHSLLVLAQFIFKKNVGIDDFFNTPFFTQLQNTSGRMSPNTAICFLLSSASLFFLCCIRNVKWFPILVASLGLAVFSFAFLPIIGFFGEIDAAYGWTIAIKMSLISSICFCVYGLSITIYSWKVNRTFNDPSMNRWFAIPYGLTIFLITIFLWQAMIYEQDVRRNEIEKAESNFIASQLQTSLESRFQGLKRMANRWIVRGGVPYNEFKSDAELYVHQQAGVNMIGIIESGNIKWEFDYVGQPKTSEETLKWINSQSKEIFESASFITVKLPLDEQGRAYLISFIYPIDLIRQIIKDDQRHYLISIKKEDRILYQSYGFPSSEFNTQAHVKFKDINWTISSYSTDYSHRKSKLSILSLLVGTVLSMLVGVAVFSSHSLILRSFELQKTQKALIEQEKLASLGALTAGIAHEIKNPLNFINNFSDLATGQINEFKSTKDAALLDVIEKNMKAINEQGNRANGIITRMLAHSRLESCEKTLVDINRLLDEDLNLALHSFKVKHPFFPINIKKEWTMDLPLISLSKEDLSRVVLNLLNNAFYALETKKSANAVLDIATEKDAKGIIIKIRDNGVGISEKVKEKLFLPFFTTKPTGQGTGLGLSLSRAYIVDELGGKIECKSKEGEFTEFTLFIPFRTEKAHLHQSDVT